MNKQQITDRVIEITSDVSYKIKSVTIESDLRKDLRMDGDDRIFLGKAIAIHFNLPTIIISCDFNSWHTVQDVVTTVLKLTGNE